MGDARSTEDIEKDKRLFVGVVNEYVQTEVGFNKDISELMRVIDGLLYGSPNLPTGVSVSQDTRELLINVRQMLNQFCPSPILRYLQNQGINPGAEIQNLDDAKKITELLNYESGQAAQLIAAKSQAEFVAFYDSILNFLLNEKLARLITNDLGTEEQFPQNGLSVEGYLIKPAQRFMKYPLLLREITKRSEIKMESLENLEKTISHTNDVVKFKLSSLHISETNFLNSQFIIHQLSTMLESTIDLSKPRSLFFESLISNLNNSNNLDNYNPINIAKLTTDSLNGIPEDSDINKIKLLLELNQHDLVKKYAEQYNLKQAHNYLLDRQQAFVSLVIMARQTGNISQEDSQKIDASLSHLQAEINDVEKKRKEIRSEIDVDVKNNPELKKQYNEAKKAKQAPVMQSVRPESRRELRSSFHARRPSVGGTSNMVQQTIQLLRQDIQQNYVNLQRAFNDVKSKPQSQRSLADMAENGSSDVKLIATKWSSFKNPVTPDPNADQYHLLLHANPSFQSKVSQLKVALARNEYLTAKMTELTDLLENLDDLAKSLESFSSTNDKQLLEALSKQDRDLLGGIITQFSKDSEKNFKELRKNIKDEVKTLSKQLKEQEKVITRLDDDLIQERRHIVSHVTDKSKSPKDKADILISNLLQEIKDSKLATSLTVSLNLLISNQSLESGKSYVSVNYSAREKLKRANELLQGSDVPKEIQKVFYKGYHEVKREFEHHREINEEQRKQMREDDLFVQPGKGAVKEDLKPSIDKSLMNAIHHYEKMIALLEKQKDFLPRDKVEENESRIKKYQVAVAAFEEIIKNYYNNKEIFKEKLHDKNIILPEHAVKLIEKLHAVNDVRLSGKKLTSFALWRAKSSASVYNPKPVSSSPKNPPGQLSEDKKEDEKKDQYRSPSMKHRAE